MGGLACHHVGKAQYLHPTMGDPAGHHVKKALHLHIIMGGPNPTTMSEGLCTYILPWEEPILPPCQKGFALTSNHGRNQSYHHVRKALHLHMTIGGTNPTTMSEGISDSSLLLGRNLDMENTKLLSKVLILQSGHF